MNRLLIKIKVPKTSGFNGEETNGSPEKHKRVCKLCKKEFSSVKALGGHMRVHIKEDDLNQNSKMGELRDCNANGNQETNNNACSLCGKSFPSMKALFGHMRCHPEREWRGINPPRYAAEKSSVPAGGKIDDQIEISVPDGGKTDDQNELSTITGCSNSVFDLAESLPAWPVTGKRGRKSIAPKEHVPDVVYNLMLLNAKIDDRSEYLDPLKKRKLELSQVGNRDLPSKKLKIDDEKGDGMKGGEKNGIPRTEFDPESVNMDSRWDDTDGLGDDSKQNSEEGSDSKNTDHSIPGKQFTNNSEIRTKGKKKIKFKDLETDGDIGQIIYKHLPINTDRYKCNTCNKSFPSHQALGGHRSSHNKGKNPIVDIEEDASAEGKAQVENLSEIGEVGPRLLNAHRCKICSKTFPTGQALGGHKRCHWTGPVEAPPSSVVLPEETIRTSPVEAPPSSVASPEETSKTGRGMLDINLNEPPPVIEDEEGIEFAFNHSEQPVDYAYSSYIPVT